MKICSKCKDEKDLCNFAWRSKSKNQLHGQCNDCRRETAKKSYQKNKEKVIAAVSKRKNSYKEESFEWKSKLFCTCCGESYRRCIEFHHLDSDKKEYDISGMMSRYPLASILQEVSKCIVVCANCHRKIHGGIIHITDELMKKSINMIHNSL